MISTCMCVMGWGVGGVSLIPDSPQSITRCRLLPIDLSLLHGKVHVAHKACTQKVLLTGRQSIDALLRSNNCFIIPQA